MYRDIDTRITDFVEEMSNEGSLNTQFLLLVVSRRQGDHLLVARMIHKFCSRVERSFAEISNYLRQPNIDYAKATICAAHLQIKTCGIGAESIRRACQELVMTTSARHDTSLVSLASLYSVYLRCRRDFMDMLMMEMQLSSLRQAPNSES